MNPDAATNLAEGAVVDGIGHAFFGELTFEDGVPQQTNFHQYQLIRIATPQRYRSAFCGKRN